MRGTNFALKLLALLLNNSGGDLKKRSQEFGFLFDSNLDDNALTFLDEIPSTKHSMEISKTYVIPI